MAMPAQSIPELMTAEELEHLHLPAKSTELDRGRLVVREPPGTRHGRIAATLAYFITDFVRRNHLGVVFAQDTGFKIQSEPDTVRAPDAAFLAQERVNLVPDRGYAALTPDLLAEIVSPDDRPGELLAKIAQWLEAGTKLVWVIDPRIDEARVYRPDGSLTITGADGALDGEDVLPGFACALKDVLS
jgi:Uma2 family endonuclease